MPASPKTSQGILTNEQRRAICEEHASGPYKTQTQLANWAQRRFRLDKAPGQSTISDILRSKDKFLSMDANELRAKRACVLKFPALDRALATWVLQCQSNRVLLSGRMIKMEAIRISTLQEIPTGECLAFSNGWLSSFTARHSFRQFKLHGESGSADIAAIEAHLPGLFRDLAKYDPRDIYNMDETALYYRMAPDRTIAARQIEGYRRDKSRITVAFTVNSDGSHKPEPFFIGQAARPHAFNRKEPRKFGFHYDNNETAWMDALIFRKWLKGFDDVMVKRGRKVLLLLDNASSHCPDGVELQNTTIRKLPPNTTAKLQPLDAGVIAAFKTRYRRMQCDLALSRYEMFLSGEEPGNEAFNPRNLYNVDIRQAMEWTKECWSRISAETIRNCWRHTGLTGNVCEMEPDNDREEATAELAQCMESLDIEDPFSIDELTNLDAEANVHATLTDEELARAAQVPDHAMEDVGDTEEMEVRPVEPSDQEKIVQLARVLCWMDNGEQRARPAVRELRRFQRALKQEFAEKQLAMLSQTNLDGYFSHSG